MPLELRICTYGNRQRIGAVVGDTLHDLNLSRAAFLASKKADTPYQRASEEVPAEIISFIKTGAAGLAAARESVAFTQDKGVHSGPNGERLCFNLRDVRLALPIPRPGKVMCMGRAFKSHAEAAGLEMPPEPQWFIKPTTCLVGPDGWVQPPKHHPRVTYGTELALVVGTRAKNIPRERALDCIWGYTILNDVTMRGRPRPKNKMFDTSGPIGPWIVPKDQIPDPQNVRLLCRHNGETVQDGNTENMNWDILTIVNEMSSYMVLEPGDVLAMGDIGNTRELKPGDVVECEIPGIGVLRNPVRADE